MQKSNPKIAIVCDWLTNFAGAERCILALHELFPLAPIYTTIFSPKKMPEFAGADIRPSFLQNWPLAKKRWQIYLPLMPAAIESLDLRGFDVIISTSHAVAKGIITKPEQLHICYCFTPMRYAWVDQNAYIKESKFIWPIKKFIPHLLSYLRVWDRAASERVDKFVAISKYVARRIEKFYERKADVIYPPVNGNLYSISDQVDDYFLVVGRQVPYKRTDIVVEAFNNLRIPLKIIGEGPEIRRLKKIAKANIDFLGRLSDRETKKYYSHAKAFIFPQEEDYGITPLEAMASGRPVIAYRGGGALETIIEGITGTFFDEQTAPCLVDAIRHFDPERYNPLLVRQHALKFDVSNFKKQFKEYVEREWEKWSDLRN